MLLILWTILKLSSRWFYLLFWYQSISRKKYYFFSLQKLVLLTSSIFLRTREVMAADSASVYEGPPPPFALSLFPSPSPSPLTATSRLELDFRFLLLLSLSWRKFWLHSVFWFVSSSSAHTYVVEVSIPNADEGVCVLSVCLVCVCLLGSSVLCMNSFGFNTRRGLWDYLWVARHIHP